MDKMPTVPNPKEEETGNAALMVGYYKYDKVKQLTGRMADDGVTPIYTEHLKLCKLTVPGDAEGRARVPSHMVLLAGVAMEVAVAPAAPQAHPKKKAKSYTAADAKREAVARGATILSAEAHAAIMDELDRRDL